MQVTMADVVDELLRYGLFLGAIFQLVCIAAVVLIPSREEGRDGGDSSDEDIIPDGPIHQPSHRHHSHHVGRRSRQEKKKGDKFTKCMIPYEAAAVSFCLCYWRFHGFIICYLHFFMYIHFTIFYCVCDTFYIKDRN